MSRNTISRILQILILGIIPIICQAAEDWPGFRGPNFDGSINSPSFAPANTGALVVSWRAKGGSGYSGISIVDGKAVTAFAEGKNDVVAAFDSKTGKELWKTSISPMYAGHDGSHDGPIATPTIQNGQVFALSAYGHLTAIDAGNGKSMWTVDIKEQGARSPHYGYTASPLVTNGVVVVQIGGEKGKAIAGFDTKTGALKWSVGDDMVNYQSPIMMKISGNDRIIAVSDKKLFVIDPKNGTSLLEYAHEGDDAATVLVPVPLDENRLLLRNKQDSSQVIKMVAGPDGKLSVEKGWSAPVFKISYDPPVFYKDHLYGFNGRILTCVDASNGQVKWKSRGVGDGFVLLVNGYLVVQTKSGTVHVGPASPEGWTETNQINLFKNVSWTAPSFADGGIFTRSHGEVARLEFSSKAAPDASAKMNALPAETKFAVFMKDLEKSQDKKQATDQFFASHKEFPIIDGSNRVTFVYRGEAEDIALVAEVIGNEKEEQMKRLPGTDVFYYTATLEPDARINYRFIKNYEENIDDPLNSRKTTDRRGGPMSWIGMPQWKEPAHLKEPPADKKGKFESHEIKSAKQEGVSIKADVYLPKGYETGSNTYPVLYQLDGRLARTLGLVQNSFDNLMGTSVKPAIVVLVTELVFPENAPRRNQVEQAEVNSQLIVEDLVPFIDSKYRTQKDANGRVLAGTLEAAADAFYTSFKHPQMFGGVATQSMWVIDLEKSLKDMITSATQRPKHIYMDWGLYDARSPLSGWNLVEANRKFNAFLKEKGLPVTGAETHEGYGWGSWRNRTDQVLLTFFAM